MSSFFLLNNIHFFLEMVGALVFLMVTWLLFDAYLLRKEKSTMFRATGFALLAVWQCIHAFNMGGDLAGYLGFAVYFLGLAAVIISFFTETKIAGMSAIIILPAVVTFLPFLMFWFQPACWQSRFFLFVNIRRSLISPSFLFGRDFCFFPLAPSLQFSMATIQAVLFG